MKTNLPGVSYSIMEENIIRLSTVGMSEWGFATDSPRVRFLFFFPQPSIVLLFLLVFLVVFFWWILARTFPPQEHESKVSLLSMGHTRARADALR